MDQLIKYSSCTGKVAPNIGSLSFHTKYVFCIEASDKKVFRKFHRYSLFDFEQKITALVVLVQNTVFTSAEKSVGLPQILFILIMKNNVFRIKASLKYIIKP